MEGLTELQEQICRLIAEARSDKEIGAILAIKRAKLRYHIRRIFQATGRQSRAEVMLLVLLEAKARARVVHYCDHKRGRKKERRRARKG